MRVSNREDIGEAEEEYTNAGYTEGRWMISPIHPVGRQYCCVLSCIVNGRVSICRTLPSCRDIRRI